MLTGAQTRAARALLGWSRAELADRSRISLSSIQRIEAIDGVGSTRADALFRVQRAFERAGVIFLDPGEQRQGGAGVRFGRSD
jgi:transcriptional regulator with XRE-family HTH domain